MKKVEIQEHFEGLYNQFFYSVPIPQKSEFICHFIIGEDTSYWFLAQSPEIVNFLRNQVLLNRKIFVYEKNNTN